MEASSSKPTKTQFYYYHHLEFFLRVMSCFCVDTCLCVSQCTSEAMTGHHALLPKLRLRGRKNCLAVTAAPTGQQIPGQLTVTFGKYKGKTFMWLTEEDVGYVKYLLDGHVKERRRQKGRCDTKTGEWRLKEQLLRYVDMFPPVSCHLEQNIDRAICGHGRFRSFTFEDMWQFYDFSKLIRNDLQAESAEEWKMAQEAFCFVRQWLLMTE
ncbi:uncharacterized protein LOC130921785 isoform X1 [Corythoichthys intestinalis]|uniref:uncharacterized protein LOC130915823 isoform X1 n=1 Tax=Corythoichthys intestinalis TaxID=161448 RepID=UPI0025A5B0A8|nr:uncharacterized protein LOC130915823 isoform X1 [Corythoichthys intestinalis]XP_057702045.1 uncharacterized protein LOC130921785 isoform X1 [Corythoichthys intestinalis]